MTTTDPHFVPVSEDSISKTVIKKKLYYKEVLLREAAGLDRSLRGDRG